MNADPNQYVTNVTPNDVLFGRGSGPNDHEGNIRFRDMVARRKAEYLATNHRQTKAKIAKEIVDSVLASNGRFLKKLEPPEIQKLGFDMRNDYYSLVDDETILEKAKQALRQNRDKTSGGGSLSPKREAPMPVLSEVVVAPPTFPSSTLPPTFVQGSHGNYEIPASSTYSSSGHVQPSYRTEDEGYAEYTTTLEELGDEDNDFYGTRRMSTGSSRRSSLLGGRKDGNIGGSRRESLQLKDVWKNDPAVQWMQMSDLLESLNKMSTVGDLETSSDTIGTIEGDVLSQSRMSMSIGSNTSLFTMSTAEKRAHYHGSGGGSDDRGFPGQHHGSTPSSRMEMSQRTSMQSNYTVGSMSTLMLGTLDESNTVFNFDGPPLPPTSIRQGGGGQQQHQGSSTPDRA